MTDPLRGNRLPSTAPDQLADGKRVAHNLGPLVGPDGTISSTSPADPTLDAPALIGTAAGLAAQADKLSNEVKAMRVAADNLTKRASRNEWVLSLTIIGLALDIGLSIFAFILLNNQAASNARLEVFAHGRCSLYSFIIPSYREATRAVSPLGPVGYDDAYRRMQIDADNLNCGIPHRI